MRAEKRRGEINEETYNTSVTDQDVPKNCRKFLNLLTEPRKRY